MSFPKFALEMGLFKNYPETTLNSLHTFRQARVRPIIRLIFFLYSQGYRQVCLLARVRQPG